MAVLTYCMVIYHSTLYHSTLYDADLMYYCRPNTSYPVSDIISSIYEPGDGCLFRFNRLINFNSETITEGEYTVSWSVYNVASSDRITGSLAQSFKGL